MNPKVTVLITVGPQPCYRLWLLDAFKSAVNQTHTPDQILIIYDGVYVTPQHLPFTPGSFLLSNSEDIVEDSTQYTRWYNQEKHIKYDIWESPWNIGFAQAFNCGVGLSDNDLIMCLAADDKLGPDAIKDCVECWQEHNQKDAWYNMSYELQDGTTHSAFNNICMITKNLWTWLGGFPPAAFAGPDALMISILMKHAPDRLIKVKEGKINCWLRQHPNQDTHRQASHFLDEMGSIRNKETERFKPSDKVKLK